ncbi:hypothetical protein A2127_00965 [Candidatus Jorgensenbacteria bacterium GWC1_48_12]|uniref:Uncharacterized protein n=1 Tax=Candidatus Jorgensenbacteria bacterium GWC1_48_12 TaxID=1798469 RepID=A0A1F6BRZ1_9BACT|nr:MAG: hypothetical protein A2127_00965 [Candidatus Jorgensenbacteria bacterium GWC1_48_12]
MKKAVLFTVVVIIVVLAIIGYVWYKLSVGPAGPTEEFTEVSPGGAKITQVDLTASNPGSKLPPGFPENIPIRGTIVESFRKVYEEYGITQYAVNTIVSQRSFDEVWNEYAGFFGSAGYVVEIEDKSDGVIEGRRGENELTIYVLPRDSRLFITIYYVEKQ